MPAKRREIEDALRRRATGYELREEKTVTEEDANGVVKTKRETTVKEVAPDYHSIMAILKAADPAKWAPGDSGKPADPVIHVVSGVPRPGAAAEPGGEP